MSNASDLLRWSQLLRPGEERRSETRFIPEDEVESATVERCQELADALRAALVADDEIETIEMGPKVIRENRNGGRFITAIAIVRKCKPEVQRFYIRSAQQRNEVLEEWVERMLVANAGGIAIVQMGQETSIGLHPQVPYGRVFEFSSPEAILAWLERGAPTS